MKTINIIFLLYPLSLPFFFSDEEIQILTLQLCRPKNNLSTVSYKKMSYES